MGRKTFRKMAGGVNHGDQVVERSTRNKEKKNIRRRGRNGSYGVLLGRGSIRNPKKKDLGNIQRGLTQKG